MKSVSEREFVERAGQYIARREQVSIERDGETVGYYLPTTVPNGKVRDEKEGRAARVRFERSLERFLAATGMTEDELADALDLNKPFPD